MDFMESAIPARGPSIVKPLSVALSPSLFADNSSSALCAVAKERGADNSFSVSSATDEERTTTSSPPVASIAPSLYETELIHTLKTTTTAAAEQKMKAILLAPSGRE